MRISDWSSDVCSSDLIPGIDMVVAVGLLAAIGPIDRFTSPARLVAFLGLNPSVHQSGNSPARHGRITKQGPCHARTMLVEAAWAAVRGPGDSEERRVGKGWVGTCRLRWSPDH